VGGFPNIGSSISTPHVCHHRGDAVA